MKKQLLLLSLLLISFISNAQLKIYDKDSGAEIKDGHVQVTNENEFEWKFKLKNTSDKQIFVRAKCTKLTNTNGEDFKMCFNGLCLFSVSEGTFYPDIEQEASVLDPGQIVKEGNSFQNYNESTDGKPLKWEFKFEQFDSATGTRVIGKPITVTYTYDPNATSVSEFDALNIAVYPTVVKSTLNVVSKDNLSVTIYDLAGRSIKSATIEAGNQKIDLSNLASQTYIATFTNSKGQKGSRKLIVE